MLIDQLTNNSSYDDVAHALVLECKRGKYTRDETIGVLADGIQESGLDPEARNPAGPWDGIFQQDGSYPGRFAVRTQILAFLDRLDAKRLSPGHGDIWLNIFWLQQAPNHPTAQYAYDHGRRGYLTEIKSRTAEATRLVDKYWGDTPQPEGNVMPAVPVGDPIWLPDVLRAEGLVCNIFPGAFERGHGDFGEIWGVVCHHTGSFGETPNGIANHPTLGLCSQLYLGRNGEYTLCGVGVAWHAGAGSHAGLPANNANFRTIGIEAANDGGGRPGKPHHEPWSDIQYGAYVVGVGAILKKLQKSKDNSIDHKEWAGAAQGKWDRGGIDPNIFRSDVFTKMSGALPPPPPKPVEVPGVPVEYANFGVIRRGDEGMRVISLQTRLKRNYSKIVIDGYFGPDTEAKVSDYQKLHLPLVVDGQVGPATAAMMKLVG